MITLSLCMIVKNEEQLLERCLNSCAPAFDEIIIVDTGSTDRTMQIAREYTSAVYPYVWEDDFAKARNYSFSLATGDYIMWLDADDVLRQGDLYKLMALKKSISPDIDIVMMRYDVGFDENGRVNMYYYRERMIRRTAGIQWQDPVHEFIPASGKGGQFDFSVTHRKPEIRDPGRNLAIYRSMIRRGVPFSPRNTLYYARELKDNNAVNESILQYERFLEGGQGGMEDNISACLELSYCRQQQGDTDGMLRALLNSFKYAPPLAEICCRIGDYHYNRKALRDATFWYQLALNLERPSGWGFVQQDYWGYYPALQLCVCLYYLGDVRGSIACNGLAKRFKPGDPIVAKNEQFFAGLKKR